MPGEGTELRLLRGKPQVPVNVSGIDLICLKEHFGCH